MTSEEERKTQQEIAQQAAVAAAQKGSSSVPYGVLTVWLVGSIGCFLDEESTVVYIYMIFF